MKQLIYRSQPFGFDEAMLAGLLAQARRNNRRHSVTGALICRHDLYIQLIEGPELAINALYEKIAVDDRHIDVRLLLADAVETRVFPEWDMLDDTMPTLTWSPDAVQGGAIEAATPNALRHVFERVAAKARFNDVPVGKAS